MGEVINIFLRTQNSELRTLIKKELPFISSSIQSLIFRLLSLAILFV